MKRLLVVLCSAVVFKNVQLAQISLKHGVTWGTITQKLDYSRPSNTTTWNMRFIENDEFFIPDGPIFISLGGECEIDESLLNNGAMYDMAQENNAIMYYIEHRYYGKSYPTSDLSTENLKYLKVEFALEDFANFIRSVKEQNLKLANNKVVVFGASYPGNLAIWMRQKYPELVHAAVSSSAPVLAKYNFFEYSDIVKTSLGTECSGVIERAIRKTQDLLQTRKGRKTLFKDFNLCQPIQKHRMEQLLVFYRAIAINFWYPVQYTDQSSIDRECWKLMSSTDGDDYSKLAAYMRQESNFCIGSETFSDPLLITDLGTGNDRQWMYQKCTEFGYFKTSTKPHHLFRNTLPLKAYQNMCQNLFGSSITSNVTKQGVTRTNEIYGGLNPNVTRVISLHGSLDPWHALGLTKDLNPSAPVIIIEGASHGADMSSLSVSDSEGLKKAKIAVKTYVKQWLQEDN